MTDHWWWRPGWQVGTRFYAWHVTLDGQDGLHALADRYAETLAAVSTLDVVRREWRHITLQGLGHVHDVPDDARDRAVEAVGARLTELGPIRSTFEGVAVFAEAIALPPSNPAAYVELRNAIRLGINDAWGDVPEPAEGFRAHASVAYSNGDGDGRAIRRLLDTVPTRPAVVVITSVSLIRMHRDRRMYEWEPISTATLG
ncbi:2'-5' RNA ligase family protein [Nocardioides speluncae]|uniref:2'-5' RNA ligase family protein n=1 Tax=Nocardioides speluncae TaxID=2670337 RepID=UPI0012B17139|nr:2'-5' RNA ligase family protein [Nocardioides speluncae]